ncbi:MAG TPA: AMP-binding protein, partial [Candidatus Acidoferrales bacterium]|nr:AMP-binding protein [Candidatus Acidoferrales bacterium]
MATTSRQLDRAAMHEEVVAAVRQLLAELGSQRALGTLRGAAHLERDLGLGSLERVELMLRLGAAFGARLPDRVVAEADTVNDLVEALLAHMRDAGASTADHIYAVTAKELPTGSAGCGLESAETLVDVIRLRARSDPTRTHIYLREEEDSGAARTSPITFGELFERGEAAARGLVKRGISPGDAVAIMLPTSREFFYTFAGVLLAGGIPVPIYPPFRADRSEEYAMRQSAILRNAGARLLVTFRQAEGMARLLTPHVPSLAGVINVTRLAETSPTPDSALIPSHRGREQDTALLQYTSGSTGDPKGVVLAHANLLANVRAIGEAVQIRPDDVVVSWLP